MFQLVVLLKVDFNCYNSFALSEVDNVPTGTQSFVSIIANVVCWFTAVLDATTQSLDQGRISSF